MSTVIGKSVTEKLGSIIFNLEGFALFNFFILMFFSFFSTDLPFRQRNAEALEAESTSIVNQLVYGYVLLSSILVIIQNPRDTFSFIQKEKYLAFFIFLCLLSAIWSDYSFLSIKRSSQLAGSFLTIINVIIIASYRNIIRVLKIISILYLAITYFSGILIPEAIDDTFGTWRGIELQKNGLGQAGVLLFNLSLFFHTNVTSRLSRLINYSISILAAGAVILSGSSTNTLGLILVIGILTLFYSDKIFAVLGLGRTVSFVIVFFMTLSGLLTYFLSSDLMAIVPGLFGKDTSLTGRDAIWLFLGSEIEKQPWFGYGYGTYWILGTGLIDTFLYNVGWKVNTAHNGYVEIILQLGFIGIIAFLILIIVYVYRIRKIKDEAAFITLITMLVINFTESLIFQYRGPTTFVFMFVYLIVSYTLLYPKIEIEKIK